MPEDGISNTTLAIVIPTWRRTVQLIKLLDILQQQIRLPDEIIIACRYNDDESKDAVNDWAKSSRLASRHKIVEVYEAGHIPPLIAALHRCESDVFCQIDDDAIPREDWLLQLEKDFKDPNLGGIGGKIINHTEAGKESNFNRSKIEMPGKLSWFGRSAKVNHLTQDNQGLIKADCFIGCNMAFRKSALLDSIDLTLNGGSAICYETDIALNISRKGYRSLYDSRVVVDHFPVPRQIEVKRGWNSEECFQYAHNLTYICFKHLRWYGKLGFLIYFFIGGSWGCPGVTTYILRLLCGRPAPWKGQFMPSLRGRLAGIRSYFRSLEANKS